MVNAMLVKEVSRALEELAAIIARLQFVTAELQKAKQLERNANVIKLHGMKATNQGSEKIPFGTRRIEGACPS